MNSPPPSGEYLSFLAEESTFPSVAAGGRPWREFVLPKSSVTSTPADVPHDSEDEKTPASPTKMLFPRMN